MEKVIPAASFSVRIVNRTWLDADTFELTCSRPSGFHFQAGQYVALGFQGASREYTLISAPAAPELQFLIKRVAGGILSSTLAEAEQGSLLNVEKLKGYLTYRSTHKTVVFAATGVGIAPFVSMAATGVRGFTLLHGARTETGLYYREELMQAASRYIACLSDRGRSAQPLSPALYYGYVTEYVRATFPQQDYEFYLCGSRAMIRDMTHLLDEHFPGTVIYSEAYN